MGPYKPLRNWVDEFPIPYYMEIMGVDRPDRTYIYHQFSPLEGLQLQRLQVIAAMVGGSTLMVRQMPRVFFQCPFFFLNRVARFYESSCFFLGHGNQYIYIYKTTWIFFQVTFSTATIIHHAQHSNKN